MFIFYFSRKRLTYDKIDAMFKLNPIGALQNLCASLYWTLPTFEYFQEEKSRHFFTVECTVMTYKVRGKEFIFNSNHIKQIINVILCEFNS